MHVSRLRHKLAEASAQSPRIESVRGSVPDDGGCAVNPFKSSIYWRLLVWFCAANLLVLFLGSYLTQRFIEYTTAVEINWTALARDANQSYEDGGALALAAWAAQQRHEGIDATLYEDGRQLSPMRLPPTVRASLPGWLDSGRDIMLQPRPGLVPFRAAGHRQPGAYTPSWWH